MARQPGHTLQCLILLLSCVRLRSKTNELTYIHQGIRCVKCAPGTYLVAHCDKEDEDARCRLCPNGTYSSQYNIASSCDPCKSACEHVDLVPVTNCTYQTNMECACPEGKFNVNAHLDLFHAKCMDYGACGPGYGVKYKGTSVLNTTCERCLAGRTYSPSTSASDKCQICTNCGRFNVIAECNGTHNRICKEEPYKVIVPPQSSDGLPMTYIYIIIGAIVVSIAVVLVVMYLYKEQLACFNVQDQSLTQDVSTVFPATEEYQMIKNICGFGGSFEPSFPGSPISTNLPNPPTPTGHQPPQTNPVLNLRRSSDVWSDNVVKIMMVLSEKLITAQSWQRIIRQLYEDSGLKGEQADTDIKVAEIRHRHNLREQIYQCCIRWSGMTGASPNVLSQVLLKEDCKVILEVLRGTFPDVFRIESAV
ncbi:tumor necrosis factor receptor superfamily member 5-like [Mizuhopecten yessoensis]|uniref:tumor necrosis factor receptor superfamily member 5-like n=1 Tax=Mizuhopecten yessoensis TaxID=6573 RepID=UPI000B45DBD3|nr:tumor necrosis factor receptor superfamily member 5-like [Mizuhopecten yessoensis]